MYWHDNCFVSGVAISDRRKTMNKLSSSILAVSLCLTLGACASNPTNSQIGAATGAVVGGVMGSALTAGSTAGTVLGAGAGAAAGYEIGKRIK